MKFIVGTLTVLCAVAQSSLIQTCLFCHDEASIFLHVFLYNGTVEEYLCLNSTNDLPNETSIILAQACNSKDCICILSKAHERNISRKGICLDPTNDECFGGKIIPILDYEEDDHTTITPSTTPTVQVTEHDCLWTDNIRLILIFVIVVIYFVIFCLIIYK